MDRWQIKEIIDMLKRLQYSRPFFTGGLHQKNWK